MPSSTSTTNADHDSSLVPPHDKGIRHRVHPKTMQFLISGIAGARSWLAWALRERLPRTAPPHHSPSISTMLFRLLGFFF
mmetsp:Transcript_39847/g.123140  ORF Transcript_39847/g.123140 Transcript_39847/m.123140 type:complete len:80 (+) Transcript_39847:1320-1559(+)